MYCKHARKGASGAFTTHFSACEISKFQGGISPTPLIRFIYRAQLSICPELVMSESSEVGQFSSTEAISQHCYTISASNLVERFVKGLGTFVSSNYVKISTLVKNTHFFFIFSL